MTLGYVLGKAFGITVVALGIAAMLVMAVLWLLAAIGRKAAGWMKTDDWQGKNGGVPVPKHRAWPPPPPPPRIRPPTVGTGTVSWTFVLPGGSTTDLTSFVDPQTNNYGGHTDVWPA